MIIWKEKSISKYINLASRIVIRLRFIIAMMAFCLAYSSAQQALTDKLLETHLHQRWLICINTSVELKPLDPKLDTKCYKWYKRLYNTLNYTYTGDGFSLTANPQRTTWYKCEQYPKQNCGNGNPEKTFYFKVYVVEGITLWQLQLNGDRVYFTKYPPILNPSIPPEIMDEYGDYKLDGEPEIYMEDPREINDDEKDIIIHLNINSDLGHINMDNIQKMNAGQFMDKGPITQVPQDGISKEYLLTFKASYCGLQSNELKVKVKRLWIEKFSHPTINSSSKWHVVVNDPVNCKASAASTIHDFSWFPYYKGWTFVDNTSTTAELNNLKFKPTAGKMPKNNSEFGPENGTILLQCRDKKGNVMGVMSSSETQGVKSSDAFNMFDMWRPMNKTKASVFFHKNGLIVDDDPLINGGPYLSSITNSPVSIPHWLYYWRQSTPRSPNILKVRWVEKIVGGYASTGRASRKGITPPKVGFHFINTTDISDLVGNSELPIRNEQLMGIYKVAGIFAFYSTLIHESWHADFIIARWPNGYIPSDDKETTDDKSPTYKAVYGDQYPDSWEKENPGNGLSPLIDDYYPYRLKGFDYEEKEADKVELMAYKNGLVDYSKIWDWSFEKNPNLIKFQGKQWNK